MNRPWKIELRLERAARIAEIALDACTNHGFGEITEYAELQVRGNVLRVTASDRYRLHTGTLELDTMPGDRTLLIHRTALAWLHREWLAADPMTAPRATLLDHPHDVELRITGVFTDTEMSWRSPKHDGVFPPVHRLLEMARAAEPVPMLTRVHPAHLEPLARLGQFADARPSLRAVRAGAFDGTAKPGVHLYAAFAHPNTAAVYAEALIIATHPSTQAELDDAAEESAEADRG